MITIKVISCNGHPPEPPICGEFDELGGVIGRAEGNVLVLPDPERYVSRMHAAIVFRTGAYVLRSLSSASPVYVNGMPIDKGNEAELHHADEIRMGAYTLQVIAETPQAMPSAVLPIGAMRQANQASLVDDPLNMFGKASTAPFANSAPIDSVHKSQSSNLAGKPAKTGQDGIPDDFDPFADVVPQPMTIRSGFDASGAVNLPDDAHLGLEPVSSQNIDQLFDLNAASGANSFSFDNPLSEPDQRPGVAHGQDPLVALGAMPALQPSSDSQRDDTPEIRAAFIPPFATFEIASSAPKPGQPPPEPGGAPVDSKSMFFSWDATAKKDSADIRAVIIPSASRPAPTANLALHNRAESSPRLVAVAAPPLPGTADVGSGDDLLGAFLTGAGVPSLEMPERLTPQMMHMFGQLLRESTQGTLDLLLARALIKREVHAEMTMIVPSENNPLKFSPSVEVALSHLLTPQGKGFMAPLLAMKDAYDDLRAHQFGFMAGMRAALAGVLHRFDPVQLEQRLTEKSMVDSLLPMNRKARLWSLFAQLYSDLIKEAEDDFHTLFGKEFLRAYQAQLAKLEQDDQEAGH